MDGIINKINSYLNSNLQLPLFICISRDKYYEVLNNFSIDKIHVSDYCLDKDKEPDLNNLKKEIKAIKKDVILVELGDFLEIKPTYQYILNEYKDLPLNSKVIILLPLSMSNSLLKMINPKTKNRILIFKDIDDTDDQLIKPYDIADGIKECLIKLGKGEKVSSLKTDLCVESGQIDIIKSNNIFEEIIRKFPSLKSKLKEENGTNEEWTSLLEELNINSNTAEVITPIDNSIYYTIIKEAKKHDYNAWKLFISLKLHPFIGNSYIKYVICKTVKQKDLLENLVNSLLDFEINDLMFKRYYDERKQILENCDDTNLTSYKDKTIIKGNDRIKYLTDNTKIEKKAIIEYIIETNNTSDITNIYPDLYDYLRTFNFNNLKITEYFSEYKVQKLTNKIEESFLMKVSDYAINRPYNAFPSRISEFNNIKQENSYLIFLDALSVESLAFITQKSSELDMNLEIRIARANLPTITEYNTDFFNEWKDANSKTHIYDLDDIKHHSEKGYDYNNEKKPIYLVDELEILYESLKRAKNKLNEGKDRVILVSDHGSSRLAVINKDHIIDTECEAKNSGRYCEGGNLPTDKNIVVEENKAIISDYSRYSGSRKATVEVHGGATLEEVLVPIVIFTLKDKNKLIDVNIVNKIIEISYNTKAEIKLIITPDYDEINIKINNEQYKAIKISSNNYIVEIYEGLNLIAKKTITIKNKGFAEKDLF